MADDLPAPLTPADLDLSALEYMPLHVERLKRSATWIKTRRNPELGYYLINLWTAAFMETPAASLPDDDVLLCEAAMCDPKRWPKVRGAVMSGFTMCADGRWYHRFVAEVAHDALEKRLKWRGKKRRQRGGPGGDNGNGNDDVHQTVHPHVPGDTQGDTTVDMGGEKPLRDGTGRDGTKKEAADDARATRPVSAGQPPHAAEPTADGLGIPDFLNRRENAAIDRCYAELRQRWPDSGPDALNWPGLSGSTGVIRMWLREGAELERDILPTLAATCDRMKAKGQKPRSFNLFTEDVGAAKARNSAPLPEGQTHGPATPRTGQPEHRDGWAALAAAEFREAG